MKHLLVVDDNDENLYLLRALLESQGYRVEQARNGAEALEMARRDPPDLIVADILMPVMDGFTLCRHWKADDRLSHVPFIFYTATYTDAKDERLALDLGADAFIVKPAEPENLMAVVLAVLARAEAGQLVSPSQPGGEDGSILKQYSEALVRRLEHKMLLLEKANQALEQEIVERMQAEDALRRQVAFDELIERLLSHIASASAAEIDGHIAATMQPIADFIGVDSAIVLQSSEDMTTWGATYSWAAPGIRSVSERLKSIPMGTFLWAEDELLAGRTVLLRSLDDMPAEVVRLRQLWQDQGLRSALMVPLRGRGALIRGCLALFAVSDGLAWERQVVRQVEQVGEAIANALERKHVEDSLRASDEQLRQSQKMEAVGQLAGGIAHDFNNLLTAILGYSDLLLARQELTASPARDDIEEVKRAAERAADLTGQILAFSRRQTLRPRVVSLNEVLTGMESLLRRTLGADIDLVSRREPDLGHVEVDVHRFEQVLMNLALNARDAMVSGGRLTLETGNVELDEEYCRTHPEALPGSHVMLAVSDTGVGMDDATRLRIFEPFFTTKAPGEGTGLGLATVYGTVKQSNGSISVYTEPGKGTSFKIYLPRVMAPVQAEGPVTTGGASRRGDETILLVEDEPSLRALVIRVLTDQGYRVLSAGTAAGALQVLAEADGHLDLLLTDMVLPGGIQGRDLALNLLSVTPGLPVLYMSGYTRSAIVHSGRLDERVDFLEKPFSPDALAATVRTVLDQGRGTG